METTQIYRSYSEELQIQADYRYHEVLLPKAQELSRETGRSVDDILQELNPDEIETIWNRVPIEPADLKIGTLLKTSHFEITMNAMTTSKKYIDTMVVLCIGKSCIGCASYHEFRIKNYSTGETLVSHSGDIKPSSGWLRHRILVDFAAIRRLVAMPYRNMSGPVRLFIVTAGWSEQGACPLKEFAQLSPVLEVRTVTPLTNAIIENDTDSLERSATISSADADMKNRKRYVMAQRLSQKTACVNMCAKYSSIDDTWSLMPMHMGMGGYSDDTRPILQAIAEYLSSVTQ